ncbi:MAG: hypothetical protein GY913_11575 [Proteobacteria bacterium]|nr:hypothetical protein [Pseudomonadota bacterium]MCP4917554.1 hypothetical protein [Pseudomonadota bacterium]
MLLLIASAHAYESPSIDVELRDEVDVFEEIEFDSGWVPSGSPVAVRFQTIAEGGSLVEMDGLSWVYWPPAITHGYDPEPETGVYELDSTVGTTVDAKIDWSGFYYEASVYADTTRFEGEVLFDPWLFEDQEVNSVGVESEGAQAELFRYEQDVITAVSIYIAVDQRMDAWASFAGKDFTTNGSVIDTIDGVEEFEATGQPVLELESTFTGLYAGGLDMVFVPTIGVCIDVVGCYDVASFDVPIEAASADFEREFETMYLDHPLPLMVVEQTDCAFGEVELGEIATCEIEILNWGDLDLEGTAGILGAGEFRVFPGDIYANAAVGDGLTVTFEPTVEGDQAADLILNTSDPLEPAYAIALSGTGIVIEPDPVIIPSEVGVCGCTTTSTRGGIAGIFGLLGLLLVRRRR